MPDEDDFLVPVHLSIDAYESPYSGGVMSAEQLHSYLEDVLKVDYWDTDPYVAVLLADHVGESQTIMVARVEFGEEGAAPFLLLPGIVAQLVAQKPAEGRALQAVTLYSEAWRYEMPNDEALATDELYEQFKRTAPRKEAKTIATVEIETGRMIHSMLTRGEDEVFHRESPLQEGRAPDILAEISQQYRAR